MAVFALTSSVIYVGGYDLSGDLSSVEGTIETNDLDVTTFGSGGWHARIAGLHDVSMSGEAFLDYSTYEPAAYPLAGSSTQTPIVLGVQDGNTSSVAYLFRGVQTSLGLPEQLGDAAKMKIDMAGSGLAARGQFLGAKASVAANGSSSGVTISALTSSAYGILSVFGASTNLNVVIESGSSAAFANAATRIQFSTTSSVGAEFQSQVSTTTNQTWRIRWTGTSTGFAVAFAIKPS